MTAEPMRGLVDPTESDSVWKEISLSRTPPLDIPMINTNIIECNKLSIDEAYMNIMYILGTLKNTVSFSINKKKGKIMLFCADPKGGCVSCSLILMRNKTIEFYRNNGERTFLVILFNYFCEMMNYLSDPTIGLCPEVPSFVIKSKKLPDEFLKTLGPPSKEIADLGILHIITNILQPYSDSVYMGCRTCAVLASNNRDAKTNFAKHQELIFGLLTVACSDKLSIMALTSAIMAIYIISEDEAFVETYLKMQDTDAKDMWKKLFSRRSQIFDEKSSQYELLPYQYYVNKLIDVIGESFLIEE